MYSPDGDFPVEIHHQLALPGTLSIDTAWNALRGYLVELDGAVGPVLRLDAFGTALHLAVHAAGLARLRDVALLAPLLAALSEAERAALQALIGAERRDPVRLAAPVALAARCAGLDWPERAGVERYIRWALRREDLPLRLRTRSDAAEIWFARPDAPWAALHHLAPWWERGARIGTLPVRIAARCAASAAALAYAARMEGGEASR
jgi:hypothetical protein